MIAWGAATICTPALKNGAGFAALRFVTGLAEAPFFPGITLMTSSWYNKHENPTRMAIWHAGNTISNIISGFLAAGILTTMGGVAGLYSWQWFFLIEGIATFLVAFAAFALLPDWPHNTRFLTPAEREMAQYRILCSNGGIEEVVGGTWDGLKDAVRDPFTWIFCLMHFALVTAQAFKDFLPSIVNTFDFGELTTYLIQAPPYAFAFAFACAVAWSSGRHQESFWHIVLPIIGSAIGCAVLISTMNVGARYFGLFLLISGTYNGLNLQLSWETTVVPAPRKLIASQKLEFFDCEWNSRGFKTDDPMLRQQSNTTGMGGKTARESKNSDVTTKISIAEGISWASKRQTTERRTWLTREEEVLKFILFLDEFVVSIALWYHRDSIYVREPSDTIIPSRTARYEQQTIYIAKDMDQRMLTSLQRTAAEALSFDPSLLPANISLTVTNIWPKKEWRPQRNKFALTGTRHFSCTIVYTVEFDGVQIGEVFLICQWHASALKPLRYALITSQNTADIVKRIQDHENGDGQGQLLEASNMMEQFIVEGFQVVKVWHDELCFSPFVKRSSETDESTNKLLFFKMASLEYLIHPMPLRLSVPRSIGDEEEPGHRLERAPQFGGDCGMLVVQQPSAADIKEAERENTD
ncbi:major facilitator superfamily transporter [Colletotrichum incanum]|uniref:Major facilitator superfamily transporter n=1 Tax=Colletotrichum incanum TaxID=1573173 RepID=A0A166R0W6_COLIC|nr:major facilitator superfamily transporter [Colletotrichum incanum]